MTRRTLTLALFALLTFVSAACTGFKRPEIELENVEIGSLGLSGGTLLVNVRVTNPNPIGVRADDLKYELVVRAPRDSASADAWRRLSSGSYTQEIEVGARQTRTVQVPVDFRYSELGDAFRSVLRSGQISYRANGTVRVRAAGASREVPFRKTGSVMVLGGR
jgi:LEA14-like dessication related protein